MNATQELCRRDPAKKVVQLNSGDYHQFSHSDLQNVGDPTGICTEEGEFLYGLVRLIKPHKVLETGTNVGISASYICLGMEHNGFGHLDTIEHDSTVSELAQKKLSGMGFNNFTIFHGSVEDYRSPGGLDLLWLDSELDQRYAELLRFYMCMNGGAIACIHDLWELDFDQFGGVPGPLRGLIGSGDLRALTFNTPHGVTVFQRARAFDYLASI